MFGRKGFVSRWIRAIWVALCLTMLALTVLGTDCGETGAGSLIQWIGSTLTPAPAHADTPVANAGGNQVVIKDQLLGASLALNGSQSSDTDGDALTFEWFGPFTGTTGVTPQVTVPEGDYTISLVVQDGSHRSAPDTVQVAVQPCFSIAARAKSGKVQLTWPHIDGTERYDVYRAAGSDPIDFVKIGETTSTYATYLDLTIQNETTYLYVVGALSQSVWCFSNVTATHPTAIRTRGSVNYDPVIYSAPIAHGTVGVVYNYDVQAADPNADSLTHSLTAAPNGMSIDPTTGLITWTPNAEGVASVTVAVEDGAGGTDAQSYAIQVGSIPVLNRPPEAVLVGPTSGSVGQPLSFDGTSSNDPDGDSLNCIWEFGDGNSGAGCLNLISNTYAAAGMYTVTLMVEDGRGGSDTAQLDIEIVPLNQVPFASAGQDADYTLPHDQATMAVSLDASASEDADGTIAAYFWSGDPDPLDQVIATVMLPVGSHTFELVVEDDQGAASLPDTVTITVHSAPNRPPIALAGGPYLGAQGQAVHFSAAGSYDPDDDPLTYQWDFGDGQTGADVAPIHAYSAVGEYTVTLTVADPSGATGTTTATVSVREENRAPILEAMPLQRIDEGQLLARQISATDPDNDPLAYGVENLPAGAYWDAPNRAFSWTPGYDQAGQYTVTFTATDPGDLTATQTWTIEVRNVNRAPILAEIAERHISETKTVSFAVTGEDPDNDALTYWAANLPIGATFDPATRNFSWTPGTDRAGTYQIVFGVSDASLQDSQNVMIFVHDYDPNHGPAIAPINPQTIDEGQLLTFTVSASDPNGDALSLAVAALPTGAVVDPTADPHALQFIWAPDFDQAGHYTMQCQAIDVGGLSDWLPVDITVNNVNRPPQLDPPADRRVAETHLLTLHVSGSDPDGDALTFEAINVPDGASFDAFSQDLTWTPTSDQAGTYTVTFRVSDGDLADAADTVIEVIEFDPNASPVIAVGAYHEIEEGQLLSFDVTAIDPNGDPLTFVASTLPTGADLTATGDPNRHTFEWTPDFVQAGAYSVNFTVTDIGGLSDTADAAIAVNNVNRPPSLDPVEDQVVEEGQELTLLLIGVDPDDDLLTYGVEPMPEGAVIDPETGLVTWTPDFDQAGTYPVTYFTSDGEFTAQQQAAIEVVDINRAPNILPASLPNARIDQVYETQVVAEDADGDPLTYTIVQTDAGVSLDAATGQLSWTPTQADIGTYMVEVNVTDGRGGLDTQTYNLAVPDTIPPSVQLSAPASAIPGGTFLAFVQAQDNVALMPVILEGTDCELAVTAVPDQWSVTPSSGMPIGEAITLTATATDTAGNQTQVAAVVVMTGVPDVTPPQISLTVPPVANAGQTIRVTAKVSDDVGVAEVRFFAGGATTPFATTSGIETSVAYTVSEAAGTALPFTATAVDTSGNTADAQGITQVVAIDDTATPPDRTPPVVDVTTPPQVDEDDVLPITVETDETCLAQIEIFINHTLAASYYAPDTTAFEVTLPPGLDPGMNALVEVIVTDCSGNQTVISDGAHQIEIAEAGQGLLTGEVYNDRTGLPLADALVEVMVDDGEALITTADPLGRYSLVVPAGTGRLAVSKAGFTQVIRRDLIIVEAAGLEVIDARLTPLSQTLQSISSVMGGEVATPFALTVSGLLPAMANRGIDPEIMAEADILLEIPPGALASNQNFTMTQLSPQGLHGILPAGWSPVGAVEVQPAGVGFQVPSTLTVPNPLALTASNGIVLAYWEAGDHMWYAAGPADVAADSGMLQAEISSSGQYVFLLPDLLPTVPPMATAGQPLPGITPALLPDPIDTRISPDPQIIFYQPGVHSDVGLNLSTATDPLSSGSRVLVRLAETYNFYAGDSIAGAPRVQDIFGYNYHRAELTAAFAVTPSFTFEAFSLQDGVIDVDALAPVDLLRNLPVIGPGGETVAIASGESITLPPEAVDQWVPAELEVLTEDTLGLVLPAQMDFVGGAAVSFGGTPLAASAELSMPTPAGFVDQGQLLLLQLQQVAGASHWTLVGIGDVQGAAIVSRIDLPAAPNMYLPGIMADGRYVMAQAAEDVGFVFGSVFDTDGAAFPGALITGNSLPVAAVSAADGSYVTAVTTGAFMLMALDPIKMNTGSVADLMPDAGDLLQRDIALVEALPEVVSFTPADGAQNVPLGTPVTVTFSETLDATTVTAANLMLAGPGGPVPGALTLTGNNTQASFRPSDPLDTNTTYVFTITAGVADLAGYHLEQLVTFAFTTLDTVPPPPPPAGNIEATIPDDTGQTQVSASQGTAGPHDTVTIVNRTQETSVPVIINADGSFSAPVNASILDEIVISIVDPAGNETVVPVGPFQNPDGSTVVGPDGGQLVAENGVILDIPAGAFPEGAVVRLSAVAEAEIVVDPGADFPFVAAFDIESSQTPQVYMNASAPLPSGTSPDAHGIVAQLVTAYGEPALAIVDTAKVIEGRLSTSSPPCPGIRKRIGRYAMYINDDQRMAMGFALVSLVAPGMHESVVEALIEPYPGNYEKAYEFVGLIESGGSIEAFESIYRQLCMPVPPDEPLKVVMRDPDSGEMQDFRDFEPIAPYQNVHIYFSDPSDVTPPAIIGINPISWVLDGSNMRIQVRFSEPINQILLYGSNPITITPEDSPETVYKGDWQLSENNTLLVFETRKQLPLGKKYLLHLTEVEDLNGNAYADGPVIFSTFKPHVIFPTVGYDWDKVEMASDLGVSTDRIPTEFMLSDIDYVTRSPDESYDGRWHTTLVAIHGEPSNSADYRLFSIDASDPRQPQVIGGFQTDFRYNQSGVEFIRNIDLIPREDSWAIPEFWERRLLYFSNDNSNVRLCMDPEANPWPEAYDLWFERYCGAETSGCGVINGGCGDLAVTIVDNINWSFAWTYDVTPENEIKWASSRMLSDNGVARGYLREWEAPAGRGRPFGLDVMSGIDITHGNLIHQNTIGAWIANEGIGLELVDIGLNIPTINDTERESPAQYPWGSAEELKLNAQLYYRDVAVIGPKQKDDGSTIAPRVVAIAGDRKIAFGVKTIEVFRPDLAGEPTGVTSVHILPNHIALAVDMPVWDSDIREVIRYDLALVTTQGGGILFYEIPEDGSDPRKVGYVIDTPEGVATKHIEVDTANRLAFVGATGINEQTGGDGLLIVDIDEPFERRWDEDEDGWNDRIIGRVPITFPGFAGKVQLNGFRYDPERGLVYAAVGGDNEHGLAIVKVRDCSDLMVDFQGIAAPDPVWEEAEKKALKDVVKAAIAESGLFADSVAIWAHGDRACLWQRGGCKKYDTPSLMPLKYEFAVLIPETLWADRDALIDKLYEQVRDSQGEAKTIEAYNYRVKFEDISFVPITYESFVSADLGLDPVTGHSGLASRISLLEMYLTGAYITDVDSLKPAPYTFELIPKLTDPCLDCPTEEPSHIWRQEGYELAKLQEAQFWQSGAGIRFLGESEEGTTLYIDWQEDLREVASAALRAALGLLISDEQGNRSVASFSINFQHISETPCYRPNETDDINDWGAAFCQSFEDLIATMAIYSFQLNDAVFSMEDLRNNIFEFQKVAIGDKIIGTEEEANAFIGKAWQFVTEVIDGPAWAIYQAKLIDDPERVQREANMANLEGEIAGFQQSGSKKIRPRWVNRGPIHADRVWARMYESDGAQDNLIERKRTKIDLDAGSEIHLQRDDFVLENIQLVPAGATGWISFTLDIPEKSLQEPYRKNNRVSKFYYILDPANPSVPALPPEPDLPLANAAEELAGCDPACGCKRPDIRIDLKLSGQPTEKGIELKPFQCVDFDITITNTSQESIQDIEVHSNLFEDFKTIAALPTQSSEILTFMYCAPNELTSFDGSAIARFVDSDENLVAADSNNFPIDVGNPIDNVDGRANSQDELVVAIGDSINFDVAVEQEGCTSLGYFWDLNDGSFATGQAFTHLYSEPGNFSVKVIVECEDFRGEDIINITVADIELQINNTAEEIDDAVRIKSTVPDKAFPINSRMRLAVPAIMDVGVVLTNPDGKLRFGDTEDETLTLTLPKNRDWVDFEIIGYSKSDNLNDALVIARLENQEGSILDEKNMTVFWTEAIIEVVPGGQYAFQERIDDDGNASVWYQAIPGPAVTINYSGCFMPTGLDRDIPQINNLRVGIVQNVEQGRIERAYSDPDVDWYDRINNDPSGAIIPAGTTVEIPQTRLQIMEINSILNDSEAEDAEQNPVAPLYSRDPLEPLNPCSLPTTAEETDNPAVELIPLERNFPYNSTSALGIVQYQANSIKISNIFRVWVVSFDAITEEVIPLKEARWKLEVDSSIAEGQKAELLPEEGENQNPTVFPVLNGPYANEVIKKPDDYDDQIITLNEPGSNPAFFTKQ